MEHNNVSIIRQTHSRYQQLQRQGEWNLNIFQTYENYSPCIRHHIIHEFAPMLLNLIYNRWRLSCIFHWSLVRPTPDLPTERITKCIRMSTTIKDYPNPHGCGCKRQNNFMRFLCPLFFAYLLLLDYYFFHFTYNTWIIYHSLKIRPKPSYQNFKSLLTCTSFISYLHVFDSGLIHPHVFSKDWIDTGHNLDVLPYLYNLVSAHGLLRTTYQEIQTFRNFCWH